MQNVFVFIEDSDGDYRLFRQTFSFDKKQYKVFIEPLLLEVTFLNVFFFIKFVLDVLELTILRS